VFTVHGLTSDGACPNSSEEFPKTRRWLGRELNPRHEDFQSSALPTELPSRARPSDAIAPLQPGRHYAKLPERRKRSARAGLKHFRLVPELPGQRTGAREQMHVFPPRNLDGTESLQMRRQPLRVE